MRRLCLADCSNLESKFYSPDEVIVFFCGSVSHLTVVDMLDSSDIVPWCSTFNSLRDLNLSVLAIMPKLSGIGPYQRSGLSVCVCVCVCVCVWVRVRVHVCVYKCRRAFSWNGDEVALAARRRPSVWLLGGERGEGENRAWGQGCAAASRLGVKLSRGGWWWWEDNHNTEGAGKRNTDTARSSLVARPLQNGASSVVPCLGPERTACVASGGLEMDGLLPARQSLLAAWGSKSSSTNCPTAFICGQLFESSPTERNPRDSKELLCQVRCRSFLVVASAGSPVYNDRDCKRTRKPPWEIIGRLVEVHSKSSPCYSTTCTLRPATITY